MGFGKFCESSAAQKRYLSPRCRLRAANWRANGGGERDTDVLRASSESGLQREPYGSMVHAITYLLARGPRQVAMGWKALAP